MNGGKSEISQTNDIGTQLYFCSQRQPSSLRNAFQSICIQFQSKVFHNDPPSLGQVRQQLVSSVVRVSNSFNYCRRMASLTSETCSVCFPGAVGLFSGVP